MHPNRRDITMYKYIFVCNRWFDFNYIRNCRNKVEFNVHSEHFLLVQLCTVYDIFQKIWRTIRLSAFHPTWKAIQKIGKFPELSVYFQLKLSNQNNSYFTKKNYFTSNGHFLSTSYEFQIWNPKNDVFYFQKQVIDY